MITKDDPSEFIATVPLPITKPQERKLNQAIGDNALDDAPELLLDPITGSPAHDKEVVGILLIHVDDGFFAGTPECMAYLVNQIGKEYKIGSEDWIDIIVDNAQNGCVIRTGRRVT